MENLGKELFEVVITAIVFKEGKYLILQRSRHEKKFPLWWTVPGGKLNTEDYVHRPKDTPKYWYNVLEKTLRREVKEEAGIKIKNIYYVTSLADARPDRDPSLVISCMADYAGGKIKLEKGMIDHRWVTVKKVKNIKLIDGIYEELIMADNLRKGNKMREWGKSR